MTTILDQLNSLAGAIHDTARRTPQAHRQDVETIAELVAVAADFAQHHKVRRILDMPASSAVPVAVTPVTVERTAGSAAALRNGSMRDRIHRYLAEHPGSTTIQVSTGCGVSYQLASATLKTLHEYEVARRSGKKPLRFWLVDKGEG
jgi:hypothetical protein